MTHLIQAALDYASRGWPVFPLQPNGDTPLIQNRLKAATTDESIIRDWWGKWPQANIAIATGGSSGLIVVDLQDLPPRVNGRWQAESLGIKSDYMVDTPNGRLQYYLHFSEYPDLKHVASLMNAQFGINILGLGGYVVAPPSKLPGGVYALTGSVTPSIIPERLCALLRRQIRYQEEKELLRRKKQTDDVFSFACRLQSSGLRQSDIAEIVRQQTVFHGSNQPMEEQKADSIVARAFNTELPESFFPTQVLTAIIEVIGDLEPELFLDEYAIPFCSIGSKADLEVWEIDSREFREFLKHELYSSKALNVGEQSIEDVIALLLNRAKYNDPWSITPSDASGDKISEIA